MPSDTDQISRLIARHVTQAQWRGLPPNVSQHALLTFVNFVGCAAGGSHHDVVERAERALRVPGDRSRSPVIGRSTQANAPLSALLNCLSASVNTFDDTHAEAMVHPSSVIGSALVALSGTLHRVSGEQFLLAFAWGIEVMCRLSKALSVPPAQADIGWSQSGVAGAVGATAACGKLLGFDADQLSCAMGIAASLSSGLRVAHGTMTMHLLPAHAASLGVQAALLEQNGFTGPRNSLEGRNGFLQLFSDQAHISYLTDGLGEQFELLSNTFKAYPCGIVIHAVIDACLQLRSQPQHKLTLDNIVAVELNVPSVTTALTDRRHPASASEAPVSMQHWAAASLLQGAAGIEQGMQEAVDDASIRTLRDRCHVTTVPSMAADASEVRLRLADGTSPFCRVEHFIGSLENPMNDAAVDRKFLSQVKAVLGSDQAAHMLRECRAVLACDDVGGIWSNR